MVPNNFDVQPTIVNFAGDIVVPTPVTPVSVETGNEKVGKSSIKSTPKHGIKAMFSNHRQEEESKEQLYARQMSLDAEAVPALNKKNAIYDLDQRFDQRRPRFELSLSR